ncbi:hypothetical protein ONZ43_g3544 [Nemania bipapillata]|uniref:Uncharacterized protein n=1 Tax=Nemania bipapillata TaxID=110536 RepID=A0ACC2IWU1_9PEZI|nr:hypothetical protein ONZ43_g3544 [Nemania bipapillata]
MHVTMDVFKNQNASCSTSSTDNGARLLGGVASHQGGSNEVVRHDLPSRLSMLSSPMFEISQNIQQEKRGGTATTKQVVDKAHSVATFIVTGEPDATRGVTKAVYHDLKEASTYLSGHSVEAKRILVEPPPDSNTGSFQVSVDVTHGTELVRPTLERDTRATSVELESYSTKYKDEFSKYLSQAFEDASSLHTSLVLRIHMGHYFLRTYKKGKFTFEAFESMVKNPRAVGQLDTRKLDWKIVATPGDEKVRASPVVKQYLEMGLAVLQGSRDDFRSYPEVRLPENHTLATKLKSTAVKSIYRFHWKDTGYVIQFAVNRRWKTIRDMNRQAPTGTDFDVTVYAQNWDEDSRVKPGETVGKIWEKDLKGLLRDEGSDVTGSAELGFMQRSDVG